MLYFLIYGCSAGERNVWTNDSSRLHLPGRNVHYLLLCSCSNCRRRKRSSLRAVEAVIVHPRPSDQCRRYYGELHRVGPVKEERARRLLRLLQLRSLDTDWSGCPAGSCSLPSVSQPASLTPLLAAPSVMLPEPCQRATLRPACSRVNRCDLKCFA